MKLSQQELVKRVVQLVDECSTFSVFTRRDQYEKARINELLELIKLHRDELAKDFVRHNLGQKRLRLIQEWVEGVGRMTKVVSMLNMKGGVGKTTLTYNLSWYAAFKKAYKVLVVDLDPQSNLTQIFLGEEQYKDFLINGNQSTVDIFENSAKVTASIFHRVEAFKDGSCIDLIPAKVELTKTLKNPTSKEHKLRRFLMEYKEKYDLVLIDCPPTDSILTTASYLASDSIIIPVKLEKLATIGLPLLASSIDEFNHDNAGENEIKVSGIIFNTVEANDSPESRLSKQEVSAFARERNWSVFESEVRESKSFVNGIREGKPMFLANRVRDYIMKEFYQVGDEFLQKVGLE
ncbi:ParA family protein [Caldibacillus lycopersici]|uniref:ParA family protein n=1 Tax=Perspicuibacillus lycopersici TaxID=1325689 RepID=A0AAE3LU07_9BACI|nr:ParA family protein [Perspicuibacillus lycopersici]MCU9614878.1 ParA family protein [Perspicuibacillus lycopersici]